MDGSVGTCAPFVGREFRYVCNGTPFVRTVNDYIACCMPAARTAYRMRAARNGPVCGQLLIMTTTAATKKVMITITITINIAIKITITITIGVIDPRSGGMRVYSRRALQHVRSSMCL